MLYKKLVNAESSPEGSPEHVHWTAAVQGNPHGHNTKCHCQSQGSEEDELADLLGSGEKIKAEVDRDVGGDSNPFLGCRSQSLTTKG